jgi:biopolymer transport protein ExbB/TolQ
MKRQLPFEFLYQVSALVIAVAIVHLTYITVIRPNAEAVMAETAARVASGESFVQEQSIYVVLKDYEQEACFVLMFWAIAIMGYKGRLALRERALLDEDIVKISEGTSVLPEDTRAFTRVIEALPEHTRDSLLPRTLLTALQRFASTRNVQDVSEAVRSVCDTESDRLDSELSMVRYISWAIPSIGFIGTVRGIGDALSQAYKAVEGDIAGVTASLGVAFNSTFVALVLSIIIMFLLHQLQLLQERLVLDVQAYTDRRLLRHLQVRQA